MCSVGSSVSILTAGTDGFLGTHDHAQYAFKLAEDYRDFRTLASLCHKEQVYPPDQNPHAIRIQSYINKFKEEFTMALYQWYIEQGTINPYCTFRLAETRT